MPKKTTTPVTIKITKGTGEHAKGYWLHLKSDQLSGAHYLHPNSPMLKRLLKQAAKEAEHAKI